MTERICSLPDCDAPHSARGYCVRHYGYWRRRGTPVPAPVLTFEERLWAKVDRSGGPDACWPWQGSHNGYGYGHIKLPEGHPSGNQFGMVYRIIFELEHGSISEGKEPDHTCRNPPCCNPAHLEPVTHQENMRRARPFRTYPPRKLICKRGHPRKELPTGRWYCPTCNRS